MTGGEFCFMPDSDAFSFMHDGEFSFMHAGEFCLMSDGDDFCFVPVGS